MDLWFSEQHQALCLFAGRWFKNPVGTKLGAFEYLATQGPLCSTWNLLSAYVPGGGRFGETSATQFQGGWVPLLPWNCHCLAIQHYKIKYKAGENIMTRSLHELLLLQPLRHIQHTQCSHQVVRIYHTCPHFRKACESAYSPLKRKNQLWCRLKVFIFLFIPIWKDSHLNVFTLLCLLWRFRSSSSETGVNMHSCLLPQHEQAELELQALCDPFFFFKPLDSEERATLRVSSSSLSAICAHNIM